MNLFCLNKWREKLEIKIQKILWINKTGPFPNKFLDGGLLILKRIKKSIL